MTRSTLLTRVNRIFQLLLSIINPDVFKSPTSETYVIFGDAKIDDGAHNKAAQAFNPSDFLNVAGMLDLGKTNEEKDDEDIGMKTSNTNLIHLS